jgi:hypothetical protein
MSTPWRWIEISPTPIPLSEEVRSLSVAPKKRRLRLPRPCASVRAIYTWMMHAGAAKLHVRSGEQAAAWLRRATEANRNFPTAYFWLAAALTQSGRLDEARSAVKAGLALDPTFAISRARAAWTAMSDDPTYLTQLEPIFDGLRKAGVPEQ